MQKACSEKRFKISSRVSEGSLKTFPDPPMRLALTSPKKQSWKEAGKIRTKSGDL